MTLMPSHHVRLRVARQICVKLFARGFLRRGLLRQEGIAALFSEAEIIRIITDTITIKAAKPPDPRSGVRTGIGVRVLKVGIDPALVVLF